MTKWYALDANGDIVGLGEHESFDAAVQWAASVGRICAWIADAETARGWLASLQALLKE